MSKRRQIGVIYDDMTVNFRGKLYGNGKKNTCYFITVAEEKDGKINTHLGMNGSSHILFPSIADGLANAPSIAKHLLSCILWDAMRNVGDAQDITHNGKGFELSKKQLPTHRKAKESEG
jgi:hypothetical protein